ncbi:MAG TPA: 4'-phosphopantetheinyl transferase superfamily protein [Pyrinomonadaceae bacterium]
MFQHLGATEVHLWYVLTGRNPEPRMLTLLRSVLTPDERDACDRFLFDKDRHQYLFAHAMLRGVLSRYAPVRCADWRFAALEYGKPRVALPLDPPLHFNLTHTEGLVACVVAREPAVGVDAEHLGRGGSLMEIARHSFAPAEVALLEGAPPDARREIFFDIWTLKEAYVKARGMGLSLPLRDFAFGLAAGRPPRVEFAPSMKDSPERWQFETFRPAPSHRIAVAVRRADGRDRAITARRMTDEELLASIRDVG